MNVAVSDRYALAPALLIDGLGGPARTDAVVVIEAGRIVEVVDGSAPLPSDMPIERLAGTLLPGLVDTHLHLAFSEAEVRLTHDEALAMAETHATELLLGGVTTARDLGVPHGVSAEVRDAIGAGRLAGPRMLVAIQPITRAQGHCHWFGRHAEDATALEQAVERLAHEGADVIKIMVTGGMSTPGSRPGVPQYSVAEIRTVVDAAHRAGLRVAAHVLGSEGIRVAVAAGVDTLEHGWTVTGAEQHIDPTVVPLMVASGITGSVTSHEKPRQLLPGEVTAEGDVTELRRRLTPHRAAAAAGVPMVVHSDCGPYRTRYDRFGLSVRVFAAGMEVPVEAAVAAAGGVAATALGLGDEVGSVAAGRRADLVLIDGDPTSDPSTLVRIRRVIQGGRTTVENGLLV